MAAARRLIPMVSTCTWGIPFRTVFPATRSTGSAIALYVLLWRITYEFEGLGSLVGVQVFFRGCTTRSRGLEMKRDWVPRACFEATKTRVVSFSRPAIRAKKPIILVA